MEQMELFETGDLQPIRRFLHVWSDAERNKKAPPIDGRGDYRTDPDGGSRQSGLPAHQAASFSAGSSGNSGQISRQSDRRC